MNKLCAVALIIGQLLFVDINAAEIKIESGLLPEAATIPTPKVKVTSESFIFSPAIDGISPYTPKNEYDLMGEGKVEFETIPSGYVAEPISFRLPTQRKKQFSIALLGLKVNDSVKRIREIYATDITKSGGLSTEDLFQLYQESGNMSMVRLNCVKTPGCRELYNDDVRIFFKFLEITRELGRTNFVKVGNTARNVQIYLREQNGIQEGQEVIKKALGIRGVENVKLLVKEIDFVDADQLSLVWDYLTSGSPTLNPKQCKFITSFVSSVDKFDERKVAMWGESQNYKFVTLGYKALQPCSEILRNDAVNNNSQSSTEELTKINQMATDVINKLYASEKIKNSAESIKLIVKPFTGNL